MRNWTKLNSDKKKNRRSIFVVYIRRNFCLPNCEMLQRGKLCSKFVRRILYQPGTEKKINK